MLPAAGVFREDAGAIGPILVVHNTSQSVVWWGLPPNDRPPEVPLKRQKALLVLFCRRFPGSRAVSRVIFNVARGIQKDHGRREKLRPGLLFAATAG